MPQTSGRGSGTDGHPLRSAWGENAAANAAGDAATQLQLQQQQQSGQRWGGQALRNGLPKSNKRRAISEDNNDAPPLRLEIKAGYGWFPRTFSERGVILRAIGNPSLP